MKIGINWTNGLHCKLVSNLLKNANINLCEILIDNFLHYDPYELKEYLGETPVSFHIMRSHFLERNINDLLQLASRIKIFSDVLQPLYISDHVAKFTYEGKNLPFTFEINYEQSYEQAVERVKFWQDCFGTVLYLENFPSQQAEFGRAQIDFFKRLINETEANILFDISNAIVAQHNCNVNPLDWLPILKKTNHFHLGSYSFTEGAIRIAIDTHDQPVSEDTLSYLRKIASVINSNKGATLIVERDHNLNLSEWINDVNKVSEAF